MPTWFDLTTGDMLEQRHATMSTCVQQARAARADMRRHANPKHKNAEAFHKAEQRFWQWEAQAHHLLDEEILSE